jgi:hypothetical protein
MLEVRCFPYWPSSGVCNETVCTRANREIDMRIARDVKTVDRLGKDLVRGCI